jgi:LPXTG-motif cell wall-anchored protein
VAVGVRVVDVLPSGLTFQSVIAPGWTCANAPARTITCTLDGPLPVDDSASLTLVVGVNAPGGTVITNTATVSSAGVLGVGSRPTDADTGTVSAPPDPNVPLPRTGTEVLRIVLTAFALVILGAALLIGKRRRTPMTPST